jgi:hypothetical protein
VETETKYSELNYTIISMFLWYTAKAIFDENFINLSVYYGKEENK